MSVIGFHFGNSGCYIAVARQGGIETIANEFSERKTPSCVSFGEKRRWVGVAAQQQMVTNRFNTVTNFKNLICRTSSDPSVQADVGRLTCKVEVDQHTGKFGLRVNYLDSDAVFTPEQITAMLFTKLKQIAEIELNRSVKDCVIGVPVYYTDCERRAILQCASMADLNPLRLINETTATALAYGLFNQDLPAAKEKSKNVAFVDLGQSQLQVSLCAFNQGVVKVLSTDYDRNVGGRLFDEAIANYFAAEFVETFKVDCRKDGKAFIKLLTECEKVKKLMSSNKQPIPINLECFMNDRDVSGRICREKFEELIQPVLLKIEAVLVRLLAACKLDHQNIHSVEIVGGSSRVPCVKALIEKVFQKPPSTMLNADECVARGCAIQCAILSPTFRVRDFDIAECQPFSISLCWEKTIPEEENQMEVFPKFCDAPSSKQITFYRRSNFVLTAFYTNPNDVPHPVKEIGRFSIEGVKPDPVTDESSRVKVKIRLDKHGLCSVRTALLYEKIPPQEQVEEPPKEQTMEIDGKSVPTDVETPATPGTENNENDTPKAENNEEVKEKPADEEKVKETPTEVKKKKTMRSVDLHITSAVNQLPESEVQRGLEMEGQMIARDKLEKERLDAKNALEEYVYEIRDKLSGVLESYASAETRESFSKDLALTEDWLYEDGEDCVRQVYADRHKALLIIGNPIVNRYKEEQERSLAFEKLGHSLQMIRKAVGSYDGQEEIYSHLSKEDMEQVKKALQEKQVWFEASMNAFGNFNLANDPPILASQINNEMKNLTTTCNPILSKPKPKVEPPPPAPEPPKPDSPKSPTEKTENMDVE